MDRSPGGPGGKTYKKPKNSIFHESKEMSI